MAAKRDEPVEALATTSDGEGQIAVASTVVVGSPTPREPPLQRPRNLIDGLELAHHRQRLLGKMFEDEAASMQLQHYVLLDVIGRGGMGLVYAAYDPKLDRKVAIKLLNATYQDTSKPRLEREAKVMAKLTHPNVVQVYDIGEAQGYMFVVMEFVEGTTLRAWLADTEQQRSYEGTLAVFIAAGRGLAAAHEAGIIHRDFKPDNVMIREGGHVLVMDFGLAGGELGSGLPEYGIAGPIDPRMTNTGAIMGTPAYMAPEQWRAEPATALADQFSFCVALWEALHGERPFAGATREALREAVCSGALSTPRRGNVPEWIQVVLVRGLQPEPHARFESMSALLDALTRDPTVRRRRWRIAGALLAGLSWGMWGLWQLDSRACAGAPDKLVGVWDPQRRTQVEAAFAGSPETWMLIESTLDRYTDAWVDAHVESCQATRRGEQSSEFQDLRVVCLDRQLLRLRATVDVLADARGPGVDVSRMLDELEPVESCVHINVLNGKLPPIPSSVAPAEVARLHGVVAQANTLGAAGRLDEGLALINPAVVEAERLDYGPLLVIAWNAQGHLLEQTGNYGVAEQVLTRCYERAMELNMREQAASASSALVSVVGLGLGRSEDARRWAANAMPLMRAAAGNVANIRYLEKTRAIAMLERKYDEALAYYEQELALTIEHFGGGSRAAALARLGIGELLCRLHRYADARQSYEQARVILQIARGTTPADEVAVLLGLGNAASGDGDAAGARAYYEQARAIGQRAHATVSRDVATMFARLGQVAEDQANYGEARESYTRELEILEELLGPETNDVLVTRVRLARLERAAGDLDAARRHLLRALELGERLDVKPLSLAVLHEDLGDVALLRGAHAEARAQFERALIVRERLPGSETWSINRAVLGLGEVASREGRLDEARSYFEVARTARAAVYGPDDHELATVYASLGDIARKQGDYEDARRLLERAIAIELAEHGEVHEAVASAINRLGQVELAAGQAAAARLQFERALELRTQRLGREHVSLADSLTGLAEALLAEQREAEALAHLERALTLRTASAVEPVELADTRFALARALWSVERAAGQDRPRALELAQLARHTYVEFASGHALELGEVEAWLGARRPGD